jgi:hypothetical protein
MGGAVSDAVDFVGDAISDVGNAVGDVVQDVGDFVQDNIFDPINDVGSDIDDFINEEIPGGWGTVVAATVVATTGIPVDFGSATTAAEVLTASEAAFVAADAAQLAAQGLSASQIGTTLAAAGVPEAAAIAAATTATGGAVASGIPVSAGGLLEAPIAAEAGGLGTGLTAGTAAPGLTATGGLGLTAPVAAETAGALLPSTVAAETAAAGLGTGLSTAGLGTLETVGGMQGLLGAGETLTGAGLGLTAPTAPAIAGMGGGTGLLTQAAGGGVLGAGGVVSPTFAADILGTTSNGLSIDSLGRAFNQAGQFVQQLTSSQVGQVLGSAAQAAVANNLAEQNAAALRGLGTQAAQRAEQIGAGANVPFTPYTVTTGLGTSQVTPTGATATAAPEYQNLRQAALQRSQEALGAINPALASQTLFGQLEALQGPARQREQEALLSRLGARGLLGFGQAAPTVGGVTRTTNPYLESLLATQAAQQAQSALAATQYGTSEAARQQALAQALQTQGLGIDEATRQQLATAGTLGLNLTQLAQAGAARQAQAGLYGLGLQTQLNLGAADIDALRRQQIAQAVQSGIGNLGGALTSAGGLLTGANALANTVGGLSAGSAFTSAPAMSGFGTGDLFGNIDYGMFF